MTGTCASAEGAAEAAAGSVEDIGGIAGDIAVQVVDSVFLL